MIMRDSKDIKLQRNNDNRDWNDQEWLEEFHDFLQGKLPKGMSLGEGHEVQLSPDQAMSVIWYLQEHLPVFPDNIEMCDDCKGLYDSDCEGSYYEIEGKHYCGSCDYMSDATYCDGCMTDVWKKDARNEYGEYYCEECKSKQQDHGN